MRPGADVVEGVQRVVDLARIWEGPMSKRLDVLFVTPPSRVQVYQDLSRDLAAIEPPVWAGLLATFIRRRGYEAAILDAEAQGFDHQQTADAIAAADPRLASSSSMGNSPRHPPNACRQEERCASDLNAMTDIPTLVMGTHPSALPKRTLLEEPYTYVCQGEGPQTILGLLEVLREQTRSLNDVPGLWYFEDGNPVGNPPAPLIMISMRNCRARPGSFST